MTDRNKLKPRRSYDSNRVPLVSDLEENEMAVNWTDGKVFVRRNNAIVTLTMGGSGGGGGSGLTWSSVPASATASGTAGDIAYSGNKLYLCTAANTWRRFTGATWDSDPYFANVSLLLHCDGASGSTTFTDSSGSPKTVTAVGNAQISSTAKFGSGSAVFDGSGDCLTIPTSSAFDFGSGDWTIEFWCKRNGTQTYAGMLSFLSATGTGLTIGWGGGDNNLRILWSSAEKMAPSTPVSDGVWTHVALVRSGGTVTLYKDGTSIATQSISGALPYDGVGLAVGRLIANDAGYEFNGYLDDIRITKGVARTITVPTAAYLDE